jgi:hypothetical protein
MTNVTSKYFKMKSIVFKDLTNDQIVDILDPAIPNILIPGFRPHKNRRWQLTDIDLGLDDGLKRVNARDLTVDLMTDKRTAEQILKNGYFNQLSLFQFTKPIPDTLKVSELPVATMDEILIHNGLINRVWVNYEFVEFSSKDDDYFEMIKVMYIAKAILEPSVK